MMQGERLLKMDPYMALSWMNTKLRNDFATLEALCDDLNVRPHELVKKMQKVGYTYECGANQWTSIDI